MNKGTKNTKEMSQIDNEKLYTIKKESLNEINIVKASKNSLFENISTNFIYNLKRLIQLEGTQKQLAKKIGVSEDLLSKYKAGDAFPSIETLAYICNVYNIKIDRFISLRLSALELESIEKGLNSNSNIFFDSYYCYFFATNIGKEDSIHEGILEFHNKRISFKIMLGDSLMKNFSGNINNSEKIMTFNMQSTEDGISYISMTKPNINKGKYVGGLAMLFLPSDANSKPCCQKLLISNIRINRHTYYEELKKLLTFNSCKSELRNLKLSSFEDEKAYNFIESLI
ncbi:helix-turn-helix domain-containing protein [Clostridium folliculivorans]|uniref:Transcriptional regulator n=1 Tax=Clostridium folliculivorans TaxID=2886038 RepID=A0A9W5Y145_9CLOT|nr:helix-turn-helix transcriptional regulator [Clostridium folliculivorans]GKU24685.1 transcriptional regulator [Clostridium folliculivorans]GKU30783.1 transcriptional regulator [Clostridium folliculivorans]